MRSRDLDRLERRLQALRDDVCPACGAPSPGYSAVVLIDEREASQPIPCSECRVWLDREGTPITPRRRAPGTRSTTKVIVLEANRDETRAF